MNSEVFLFADAAQTVSSKRNNLSWLFCLMLSLGQDITFDEITAKIQISDENNNPPVFTQTRFIGGKDAN